MRLRCVAITSQSSTSALQSQTNELQEVSCHDRWEGEKYGLRRIQLRRCGSWRYTLSTIEFCEGATMKIAGSKSERRFDAFARSKSSLGVSLFCDRRLERLCREASLRWAGLVVLGRNRLGRKWGAPVLLKTQSLSQDWGGGLPGKTIVTVYYGHGDDACEKGKTISKLLGPVLCTCSARQIVRASCSLTGSESLLNGFYVYSDYQGG